MIIIFGVIRAASNIFRFPAVPISFNMILYAHTCPDFFFTKHYTVSKCEQCVKDGENEEGMTWSKKTEPMMEDFI